MDRVHSIPDRPRSSNISPAESSPRPLANTNSKARRPSSLYSPRQPYAVEKRPTFGQWLKLMWPDFLAILVVGAAAFPAYYFAPPLGTPSFPLDSDVGTDQSGSGIPPRFAYPARTQIVSNWLMAIIAIAFPVITILLMQIWIRSFWDLNNGLFGFTYALLVSSAFQGTVKGLVGGLRPNFYDVCKPDPKRAEGKGNKTGLNGIGFRGDMYTKDACTTTNPRYLRNAMQSFPSGHSTTITAAAVFICLYLNAKLKIFANYHTPLWKLIALVLPLLAAVLFMGTLIIDNTHSWYDIAGGATIGTFMAFTAFRMVYASVFDWRINHIPLNRNVPFDGYSRRDMVATTRTGWQSPMRENDTIPLPDSGHDRLEGDARTGSKPPNQSLCEKAPGS
ncbi:PAP2 superfamily-domain-containing protein [Xylariaceae sp. AK1471]|nr:PAP2 superfamily-domain-containing protein [Xylariaceae sp. AK1471]